MDRNRAPFLHELVCWVLVVGLVLIPVAWLCHIVAAQVR